MMWTVYQLVKTNSATSRGKNKIRGSPKNRTRKSNEKSWPALVPMQVLLVVYIQKWTAVAIWVSHVQAYTHINCMPLEIDEPYMLVPLSLERIRSVYEDLTLLSGLTYIAIPCVQSVPFRSRKWLQLKWNVVVMQLLVSKALYAVHYWVKRADGNIQWIQWGAYRRALLRQTAVSLCKNGHGLCTQVELWAVPSLSKFLCMCLTSNWTRLGKNVAQGTQQGEPVLSVPTKFLNRIVVVMKQDLILIQ